MTARALIIKWFTERNWDRAELVAVGKVVSPPGASWPEASSRQKETFYHEMLDFLENELARDVTIAVFEKWAETFPAEMETLNRIAQGLHTQGDVGADIEKLISEFPIEEGAIRLPSASDMVSRKAPRTDLFSRFLEFAQARDIVFALGGVGSGLDTFTRQFADHVDGSPVTVVSGADFRTDLIRPVLHARAVAEEARSGGANVHLELKCLLTTLAYATYSSLHGRFPDEVTSGLDGRQFPDVVAFSDYYYSECRDGAMYHGERDLILRHFFEMTQRFAEMIESHEVLVFMPWKQLAACFHEKAKADQKKYGDELWKALSEKVAAPSRRSRLPFAPAPHTPSPLRTYDRVCLVVCCREIPFAHSSFLKKELISRCVWPIPPLPPMAISQLVSKTISSVEADTVGSEVAAWTGGAPWFVRLLLSYVAANQRLLDIYGGDSPALVAACARKAMDALEAGGDGVPDPVGDFIRRQMGKVRRAFGDGHNDDATIEEKWAGPMDEVAEGYPIEPHRLEAFVASGMIWLKGDPWKPDQEDYVFSKYPVVFFERARELQLAVYRSVTGKKDMRLGVDLQRSTS